MKLVDRSTQQGHHIAVRPPFPDFYSTNPTNFDIDYSVKAFSNRSCNLKTYTIKTPKKVLLLHQENKIKINMDFSFGYRELVLCVKDEWDLRGNPHRAKIVFSNEFSY